jgi:hypothetical protein
VLRHKRRKTRQVSLVWRLAPRRVGGATGTFKSKFGPQCRMGDEFRQLLQQIRGLGPREVQCPQEFIDGWNRFNVRFPPGFPEDRLWVNFVANHREWAGLLGVTVNPRHHWPFARLRCPSPCPLCDRPEKDEQGIREAVEREEKEARQRQEEQALREAQELLRRDQQTEEYGRRFQQREEALASKKQLRKKEKKANDETHEQFRKEAEKNPRLNKLLAYAYEFLAGWPKYIDEHKGVPEAKLWLAYVANNPVGAAGFGAEVKIEEHLPQVVNGCLTPCCLCDKVQPLETRKSVWDRTQQLLEQATKAREQRERAAAAEAAKAQAEAAQRRRERKAEAREKRRAEEALRPRTPEADVGSGCCGLVGWGESSTTGMRGGCDHC